MQHDWYQTETQVVVEVRIKNMKNEDVKVDIQDTSLSVTAKLAVGTGNTFYNILGTRYRYRNRNR